MKPIASRSLQALLDLGALAAAYVVAFGLRFDWQIPPIALRQLFVTLPYVVAFQYLVHVLLGTTRYAWRYVGLGDLRGFVRATMLSTGMLMLARLIAEAVVGSFPPARHALISTGVLIIDSALALGGMVGMRIARRLVSEGVRHRVTSETPTAVRTILIGAGQAGVMVARELDRRPDLALEAVAFVDDDPMKVGSVVAGVKVWSTTDELAAVAARTNARQALITIAGASGQTIRKLMGKCDAAGLPAKIIPAMHEIVGGHVNLSRVRPIAIEDLLRRDPVSLDADAISEEIRGRIVLVSGAGGSIGSELCRQICRFEPAKLLLLERAENSLFQIHRELNETFPQVSTVPLIGDVTDRERVSGILRSHRPRFVLHAAAHKHVPMMEWNVGEAVKNNILGTKLLASLASEHGVEKFVLVSTDKAVNPTSVMGATKRAAELYLQVLGARSATRFITVRFGNVLGSAGSVVPIFQRQIESGGPVTVTHPEMTRYFMTIPEASQLVLQAATMGRGGEIFVLDMGEPVKIVDLARDLIRLSGFRPDEDIEIAFAGIRPGEKLFEELGFASEGADKTRHPKIWVGRQVSTDAELVSRGIDQLASAVDGPPEELRQRLRDLVPEFAPPAELSPAASASTEPKRAPVIPATSQPALGSV